ALVLRNAPDPDKRVAAVMALRRMAEARSTPLLRIALRDPVDDVRLLAYALTDGIDKEISKRIQRRLSLLDLTPLDQQARLRKALAQDYWDMAFLGLASGDVESHVLREAAKHLERVLDLRPDGGAALLLGRVRLRQNRPTEAEAAFARARALGLPSVAVGPYRAEAAFLLRRFDDVRRRLSELPPTSRARLPLAEVLRFWIGEERD
ncbi:MAG: HEAT repeat domain-containing protein, partial [Myxococcota bacterium]